MEGKLGEMWWPEVGADAALLAPVVVVEERARCSTLHRTLDCIPEIKSIDEYSLPNWGTHICIAQDNRDSKNCFTTLYFSLGAIFFYYGEFADLAHLINVWCVKI